MSLLVLMVVAIAQSQKKKKKSLDQLKEISGFLLISIESIEFTKPKIS